MRTLTNELAFVWAARAKLDLANMIAKFESGGWKLG
jgi:hypothetical protein